MEIQILRGYISGSDHQRYGNDERWTRVLSKLLGDKFEVIEEGLTMYLLEDEIQQLLKGINQKLGNATILFDAYSKQTVKSSKIKNPVNQMNASVKWGMNTLEDFNKLNPNLKFSRKYFIKYKKSNLKGMTKFIFENLYCGKISESLYKIYEFELKQSQEETEK